MKILQVRFSNLNSLQGSQLIDFTAEPLANSGIFAITGPTGAGKSTILDAITLGLFGRAARYRGKPSPPDMISRGTAEASAEVTFSIQSRNIYRASWYLGKARKRVDGAIQQARRFIYDQNNQEIASGARPCDEMIVDLTGLTPDRFFRSAMLAQGEFAKFLQADERERAELLESLTNTEIYSELSSACYRRYEETKQNLLMLQSGLDSISVFSESELEQLQKTIADKRTALKQLKDESTSRIEKVKHLENRRSIENQLTQEQQRLSECQIARQNFSTNLLLLQRHKQASVKSLEINTLEILESQTKTAQEKLADLSAATLELGDQFARASYAVNEWCNTTIALAEKQIAAVEENQFSVHYRINVLDLWLTKHQKFARLESALPNLHTQASELALSKQSIKTYTKATEKYQDDKIAAAIRLERFTQEVVALNADAIQLATDIQSHSTKLNDVLENKSIDEASRTVQQLEEDLRKLAELKTTFEQQYQQKDNLQSIERTIERFLQEQHNLETVRNEVVGKLRLAKDLHATLTENKLQAITIRSLDDCRSRLQDNEPCPLCGSREHPLIDVANPLPSPNEIELKLEAAQKQIEAIEQEFSNLESSINRISNSIELNTGKQTELTQEIAAITDKFNALSKQLSIECLTISDIDSTISPKQSQLKNLESSLRAARELQHEIRELESQQLVLSAKLTSKQEQVTEIQGVIEQLETDVNETQLNLSAQVELDSKISSSFFQKVQEWIVIPPEGKESTALLQELSVMATLYRRQIDDKTKQETKLTSLEQKHANLQLEKNNLLKLKQDCQQYRSGLNEQQCCTISSDEVVSNLEQASAVLQEAHEKWQKAFQELRLVSDSVSVAKVKFNEAHQELSLQASDLGFASLEELRSAILPAEQIAALENEHQRISNDIRMSELRITACRDQLLDLSIKLGSDVHDLDKERDQLARLEESRELSAQELGKYEQQFAEDTAARAEIKSRGAELDTLIGSAETQRVLNELIGSADGKKFRTYTQSLMLGYLLANANRHLRRFNDRYELTKEVEGSLLIDVMDRHQAGMRRPLASLSGGESFLVSLALALGLSDLSGSNVQLDSLFIDEGFGTLDSISLDMAISALETLHGENKTIGVISHAEMLRERITTQIRVHKRRNGISEIEFVG